MKRGFAFLGVVAMLTALSGCQAHNSWHQKTTMAVETPSGPVEASSVVKVESFFGRMPLSGNEVSYKVAGEAVVLDLGAGRYLFALLSESSHEAERFYRALGYDYGDRGEKLEGIARMQGTSRLLEPGNYPRLVTFGDINDPTSVERVDPADLAASFGPGYSLASITLEITDEPVTQGRVEAVLGWWCEYRKRGARLSGATSIAISSNELSEVLGTGAFRIGDCL